MISSAKHLNIKYTLQQCKLSQGTAFARDVKAAPTPQVVLFFDHQIRNMCRFLTDNRKFSVFKADVTFNLGQFYVTPISYEHLLLQNVVTGKSPIMLGPILVHC